MKPYYTDDAITLYLGDALEVVSELPSASVDCCVTSPPYFGLRDYGEPGQYGLEPTPADYVETLRALFAEVRRVLADDGTLWLNIGDSYSGKANGGATFDRHRGHGHKAGIIAAQRNMSAHAPYKSLLQIPARVSLALVDDGWTLRNDIIWAKPNGMPESITDRLAGRYEHVYLLTKGPSYRFDLDAIREEHSAATLVRATRGRVAPDLSQQGVGSPNTLNPRQAAHPKGRNPGDVWSIPTAPFPDAHFAAMPPALASRCVSAGAKRGGVVLDPFSGSGTTGLAATMHGCRYVGVDLSEDYLRLSLRTRLSQPGLDASEEAV